MTPSRFAPHPPRPWRILDLCCGAGLAADGYAAVGLSPVGADTDPNPLEHYPYARLPAVRGDVLEILSSSLPEQVDAIHVSPPCQLFTRAAHLRDAQGGTARSSPNGERMLDLLTPSLELLRERWSHKPWVVENVENAGILGLMEPDESERLIRLCGSMFGLKVQRHRLFLANVALRQPACDHAVFEPDPQTGKPRPWGVYHVPGDSIPSGGRTARNAEHAREVLGSHRALPYHLLKEGFPPAYAAHVGADLLLGIRALDDESLTR